MSSPADIRPRSGEGRPQPTAAPTTEELRPPMWLLGLATLAIVASAGLLQAEGRTGDLIGYLLATLVTVLLIAAFRSIDNRRRSRPTYVLPPLAQRVPPTVASWMLLAVGVTVGAVHVWRFADAVARQ